MRLVFFGTAEFAVPSLERLAPHVVLVVSQPDRPSGRGMRLQPSPVSAFAERRGLALERPERCREPEFIARIEALKPDALVVAAYGQILPQRLLDAGARGAINVHGSVLPAYRGAAPIQRAILQGEAETGVTLMQMDKGMDTGDMIAIARTPIGEHETAGELTLRLATLGAGLCEAWLPRIATGDYTRTKQDDGLASYAPKVEKAEAELSPTRAVQEEYRRFRAFMPAPGPFVRTRWGALKLREVRPSPLEGPPGQVLALQPHLVVGWHGGAMEWRRVQPEGKTAMQGVDWANGVRIGRGDAVWPPEAP